MYITTNIPVTINQTASSQVISCPIVCAQQLYAYINLSGLVFGLLCLVAYIGKKKLLQHRRTSKKKILIKILSVSFWLFLILFILYFLKIEYKEIEGQCITQGILLNISSFPDLFHPLYSLK